MLVLLAVWVGSVQLNMARRAQGHPGSDPGVFPRLGRFLVDLAQSPR